jgi:hypothetical protein
MRWGAWCEQCRADRRFVNRLIWQRRFTLVFHAQIQFHSRVFQGYPEHLALEDDDSCLSFGTKRAATEGRSDFARSSSDQPHPYNDFVPSSDSASDDQSDARVCSARILDVMEPDAAGGAFARDGAYPRHPRPASSLCRVAVIFDQEPTSAGIQVVCIRMACVTGS